MVELVDVTGIKAVLLVDGWSPVLEDSFEVGVVRYQMLGGRQIPVSPPKAAGVTEAATWKTQGNSMITCPLSAIQAIKWE